MLRRYAFTLIAVASMLASSEAQAQTVLARARLGNSIEDITFVPNGRLANNLAFLNGNSLYVAPLPKGGAPVKLFDMRDIPDAVFANGLTYIPSQKLFAFHHSSSATLYLVDENGVFQGTRPMVFPVPGVEANYLEAMDYLPPSSAFYPDHLIAIANTFTDPNLTPRIEVVRLDGTVEHEIVVQPYGPHPDGSFDFDPSYGLGALAYRAPDRLLVNVFDGTNTVWALDFTGNVVGGGPVYSDSDYSDYCEAIVQVPDGRIVAARFFTGKMLFFDQNMNRRPADDRTYGVGVGTGSPRGIAWNSDTGSHLVLSWDLAYRISAVSQALDSGVGAALNPTPAQPPSRLAYISGDHLVATWIRRRVLGVPRNFITLYDPSTGAFHSELDVTATLGSATGPRALEYIPSTDQFAVVMSGEPNTVKIASRTGALVRSIDISGAGVPNPGALAFFDPSDPSGGRMLLGNGTNAAVVDFNGAVLPGGFNIRDGLNLLAPADFSAITTGPQAGAFAAVDSWTNELVVFKLCALCGYLRGTGPDANPPILFLGESPSASTPKYRDSAGVNFAGGNAYKEIGTWTVTPSATGLFGAGLHAWAGLKNSDDTGARFDLRLELYKNGALFASGLKRCVTGLTRNANDAAEVAVSTGSFLPTAFNGSDVLGVKILTRIGTNPDNTRCSGAGAKNSAAGLRLYFDSMSRPSYVQANP